ncbi:Beta-lactamase OXA-1 precursor [compost metagenome]
MLRLAILASCFALISCSSAPKPEEPTPVVKNPNSYFTGVRGCFVLFSIEENRVVDVINPERCAETTAPCSTFKVPLAVMAFDSKILKNEKSVLKWDKKKRMVPAWNKDQTATSWMHESVVWYSQRLTPKLGRKKIEHYLSEFSYGNEDFSGGLTDAWLTEAKFSKNANSTLKISAMEQVDFLSKLWKEELPVSKDSQTKTKKIMPQETTANGSTLTGKTGSGYVDTVNNKRLAWYVAHVDGKDGHEYISVVTFDDIDPQPEAKFGGGQAKSIMKSILEDKGL